MKRMFALGAAVLVALTLTVTDAEAKRLGGGRSIGTQRTPVTQPARQTPPQTTPQPTQAPAAAPNQLNRPQTAPAPQASGWRRWAAPLAGLAAGIGLAALASHFGLSGDFAGLLLMVGIALIVVMVVRRMLSSSRSASSRTQQYAGAGAPYRPAPVAELNSAGAVGAAPLASGGRVPAGFDVEGFLHQAKVSFIRLQAANDAGNLDDLREFMTPEMFAEARLELSQRNGAANKTDVVQLNSELLDVSDEGRQHLASVRFSGLLREDPNAAPQAFDEVWHLSKPVDGSRGWALAGIEQLQ